LTWQLENASWGAEPTSLHVIDEALPRLAGFASTQLEGEQFLAAIGKDRHGRELGALVIFPPLRTVGWLPV
jgi:hypothetical protein